MFNCIETFLRYSSTSITRSKNPVNQSFFLPYKKRNLKLFRDLFERDTRNLYYYPCKNISQRKQSIFLYKSLRNIKISLVYIDKRRIFGIVTNSTSKILSIIEIIYDLPNEKRKWKKVTICNSTILLGWKVIPVSCPAVKRPTARSPFPVTRPHPRSNVARKAEARYLLSNNEGLLTRNRQARVYNGATINERTCSRLVLDHYWTVNRGRLTEYLWRARCKGDCSGYDSSCAYHDGSRAI